MWLWLRLWLLCHYPYTMIPSYGVGCVIASVMEHRLSDCVMVETAMAVSLFAVVTVLFVRFVQFVGRSNQLSLPPYSHAVPYVDKNWNDAGIFVYICCTKAWFCCNRIH